jgi:hypothetical protein
VVLLPRTSCPSSFGSAYLTLKCALSSPGLIFCLALLPPAWPLYFPLPYWRHHSHINEIEVRMEGWKLVIHHSQRWRPLARCRGSLNIEDVGGKYEFGVQASGLSLLWRSCALGQYL